jgi:hypothetical protein
MTLLEMKKKVLGMIEELNPNNPVLTDDPDIATKINEVINQVMFELVRQKKIAKYVEMEVTKGDIIDFAQIESECGYEIYQVAKIGGVDYDPKANNTIFKMLESGTAEIEVFVYPERITEITSDKGYEFELSPDVLEIMPYGVAADLLKSDVSTEYGAVYAQRYADMVQMLDPRNSMNMVFIEGWAI